VKEYVHCIEENEKVIIAKLSSAWFRSLTNLDCFKRHGSRERWIRDEEKVHQEKAKDRVK